jgi:hypothetical protein
MFMLDEAKYRAREDRVKEAVAMSNATQSMMECDEAYSRKYAKEDIEFGLGRLDSMQANVNTQVGYIRVEHQ